MPKLSTNYSFAEISSAIIPTDVTQLLLSDRGNPIFVEDLSLNDDYVLNFPRSSRKSANGRFFRLQIPATGIEIEWLGGEANDTTDNLPAFNEAVRLLSVKTFEDAPNYSAGTVLFRTGRYFFSDSINLRDAVNVVGHSGGTYGNDATWLRFPDQRHGIIINSRYTNGYNAGDFGRDAAGTVIRNVTLKTSSGAAGDFHGIFARARFLAENVKIHNFAGCGIYVRAGAEFGGNANCFRIVGGRINGCRDCGIKIEGGDTNAGSISDVDLFGNGNWGILDVSFLGNIISGCHAQSNGETGVSIGRTLNSVVSHNGKQWYLKPGQESAGSTTTPGTNDTVWMLFDVYEPISNVPAWFNGIQVKSGGAYGIALADAAGGSILVGCYAELGQAPTYVGNRGLALGGTLGSGVAGPGAHLSSNIDNNSNKGMLRNRHGFVMTKTTANGTVRVEVGKGETEALTFHNTAQGASWHWNWDGGGDVKLSQQNRWYHYPYLVTGPGTGYRFGRDPNLLAPTAGGSGDGNHYPRYRLAVPELALGTGYAEQAPTYDANGNKTVNPPLANVSNGRIMAYAAAKPSYGNYAQGEIRWNTAPVTGGVIGWVCTGSGSPGTWEEIKLGGTGGSLADNSVTNPKLADMTQHTIKGRVSAGTGDPEDLSGTQVTAILPNFGASNRGVVPASNGGTTNFLRADGSWAPPPAGSSSSSFNETVTITTENPPLVINSGVNKLTLRSGGATRGYLDSNATNSLEFKNSGGDVAFAISQDGQTVRLPQHNATTGTAANMVLDNLNGNRILRSTSSRRYKQDIQPLADERAEKLLEAPTVTYRSRSEHDDPKRVHWGLIAEDLHDLGLTELVTYNAEDEPEAVQYERVVVGLLHMMKSMASRLESLEQAIGAAE